MVLPRWKFASGRYQLRCHFLQLLQFRCSLHIEPMVLVCRVIVSSCEGLPSSGLKPKTPIGLLYSLRSASSWLRCLKQMRQVEETNSRQHYRN